MLTLLILFGSLLVLSAIVAAFVWTWRKLRPKGPGRRIFFVAFVAIASLLQLAMVTIEGGWIVVAIIAFFVFIWFVLPRKGPWRIIYVALLMLAYTWLFEAVAYDMHGGSHPWRLREAFGDYLAEHGELTDALADMEIMYRGRPIAGGSSLTAFGDSWGPAPIYLRADQPGLIIALLPPTRQQPRWGFVRLTVGYGKGGLGWADEADLAGLLDADDIERAELGEPGRWADINWRK